MDNTNHLMWSMVFLCCTLYILPTHQESSSLQILGLFSLTNCGPNLEHECVNAQLNEVRMRKHHEDHHRTESVKVCTIDISNDHKKLITMLLYLKEIDNIVCRDGSSFRADSFQLMIFTYMSFELTQIASSIVLPSTQAMLVSVTDRPMHPAYYVQHPLSVYSYEASFGKEAHKRSLMKVKNDLNITYGVALNIKKNHPSLGKSLGCSNEDDSAMCVYSQDNPTDCYKEMAVIVNDTTEIDKVKFQLAHDGISFVLLSGERQLLQMFEKQFGYTPFIASEYFLMWYVTNTTAETHAKNATDYDKADVLLNFLGAFAINKVLYYALNLRYIIKNEPNIWNRLLKNHGVQTLLQDVSKRYCFLIYMYGLNYKCGDVVTVNVIKEFKKRNIFNLIADRLTLSIDFYKVIISYMKNGYYLSKINYKRLFNQTRFNPEIALKSNPNCNRRKPNCNAGTELLHSFYKETNWTRSFGWNCQKCGLGYFKNTSGNMVNCSKCYYPYTTNKNRTSCYDPFRITYVDMSFVLAKIVVAFSSLTLFSIIATAIIFAKARNTPVVMSANRKMTSLQLFGHTILAIIPICMCVLNPSKPLCITSQVLIGFSFAVSISVNISKTQKLFMIVNKKVVMNKSEIFLVKASEWFIIILILTVNTFTHITTIIDKSVIIKNKYYDTVLEKGIYCSNLDGVYIQILFAAVLIFCNGIQGFRARKLPSRFRETSHVIYSSFASIVVYISSSAIYFNEIKETNKLLVLMTTVLLINIINFSLLYYYKVYFIIFKPEMNTKKAFNEKRLRKMGHDNVDDMSNNL